MTDDLLLREHETPEGLLVAVCDRDALGETFADGDVSITVTESFYGGDPQPEDAVVDGLDRAAVANIVGEEAVALAVDNGFVDPANVLEVGATRHAQTMVL